MVILRRYEAQKHKGAEFNPLTSIGVYIILVSKTLIKIHMRLFGG